MHAHTLFNTIKTIQGKHGSKAKSDAAILSRKKLLKIFQNSIDLYIIVCYCIYRKEVRHETDKHKTIRSGLRTY